MLLVHLVLTVGPIPARTGQPRWASAATSAPRAYPRSHGATNHKRILQSALLGLSPLARGNRAASAALPLQGGPIPARTGQPRCWRAYSTQHAAYPRSHGATYRPASFTGNRRGLSPLARGNLARTLVTRHPAGPIPARTGQPPQAQTLRCPYWAYPRSHGATSGRLMMRRYRSGLSPLARGNLVSHPKRSKSDGPIPARTGQPHISGRAASASGAYPRSHGATKPQGIRKKLQAGLSPLARGNPRC